MTTVTYQADALHITSILGTARPGSSTSLALAVVAEEFARHADVDHEMIDIGSMTLPFPGAGETGTDVDDAVARLRTSAGILIATPEYHGSFSGALKVFIENMGFPSVLKGKPVSLLGVAAGRIGAIKSLEHLRSVCSHIGAIVLPGPASLANVRDLFDADGRCTDPTIEEQLRGLATGLLEYVRCAACPPADLETTVRS